MRRQLMPYSNARLCCYAVVRPKLCCYVVVRPTMLLCRHTLDYAVMPSYASLSAALVAAAGFEELCGKDYGHVTEPTGGKMDINECHADPNICGNGFCINTDGSFRCECRTGFTLDRTGRNCIGTYALC